MMQPDDKIITFESYRDPMLAHIIRTKLEAGGIPCFIVDDHMAGLNPLYSQSTGIKLNIFERDLEKCRLILAEDKEHELEEHVEIDPETEAAIFCPYCTSTNVSRIGRGDTRPEWMDTLFSFFANIFPSYSQKVWHCFNCRQDFE